MRLTGVHRVWLLTLATAAGAALLYATTAGHLPEVHDKIHIPWWSLAAGFAIVEMFPVHLHFRKNAYSFTLSEIPLVLGLFFTGVGGLIAAQVVGAILALAIHRRQSLVKMCFNVAQFALEACLAASIFYSLMSGLQDRFGPGGWATTFAATVTWAVTQYILIGTAISLAEGQLQLRTLIQGITLGMPVTLTNTCLALLAVTILEDNPVAAWLLLVPVATLYFSYRAYTNERLKHESIESLYETSRMTHGTLKVEDAMRTLLAQACEMFRAEMAMITLFPAETGAPALRTTYHIGKGTTFMKEMELHPAKGVWARVAAEEQAVLIPRPIQNEALRLYYAEQGIKDAMVAPLHGEDKVVGVIHVCNRLGDITTFNQEDLKLFETLVNHASVSIENARLVAKLEESLEHLTEMNRLKDDFVASVSHELRTPLTSIRGYVQTLLRPDAHFPPEETQAFLETINRQSQRLHRLIEDLLVVSRIESASADETLIQEISLADLIDDVVDELRAKLEDRALDIKLDDGLPLVETDTGKVHQILVNLIDNAVKYSPAGAPIDIAVHTHGAGVTITVKDSGPGIHEDAQERIFDRFYQVDQSATRKVGGAGLGLYICRKLAEALGGRLWLESSGPEGSQFSLWIPTSTARPSLDLAAELERLTNLP